MKKLKAILCILILSIALTGKASASTGADSVIGFFSEIYAEVMSLLGPDDGVCPLRQCTQCKPISQGGTGNCRPR